ncbi:MAG: polysaccharide biosynthesis/export family protein [Muribaculaceae bacterium]
MKTKFLALIFLALIFGSCASTKNITYLREAESIPQELLNGITPITNPVVMPGDLIDIIVSGINMDAVKPFNRMDFLYQISGTTYTNNNTGVNSPTYYLVSNEGNIDFPVLGKLHIGGLNKTQIEALIISEIYPKYLKEKPTLDIRFKNFQVSVIGEVKTPGVYTAPNERFTVLEALASAGDLTITGERKNVMLIRTNADGTKTVKRLDLNDKNTLLSPYYNLQQNDVIYVEPNASKARSSWIVPPAVTLLLSTVGTLISVATLIVTLVK